MLNLIRLEWKKNNIGKYIRNAAIMTFVLLFFILLMAGELDADTSMEAYNGSVVNTTVDLFTHMGEPADYVPHRQGHTAPGGRCGGRRAGGHLPGL